MKEDEEGEDEDGGIQKTFGKLIMTFVVNSVEVDCSKSSISLHVNQSVNNFINMSKVK